MAELKKNAFYKAFMLRQTSKLYFACLRGAGCSDESTRLPPMWPGFDSWTRRHMWVEFVVGSLLCSERFFSGYSGFPLSAKTNISKFQFDPECSSV